MVAISTAGSYPVFNPFPRLVMRFVRPAGVVIYAALALTGCGSGNKAKAEKSMADTVAEMNKLIAAFESGDKAAVRSGIDRVIAIARESKGLKVTKSENDALKKKSQELMGGMPDRLANAMKKSVANGTFTPGELQDLAAKMREVSESMR
jgi:hypothetical protein